MLLLASVVFLVFSLLRKLFCALNSSISQLGFSIRSTPMTCSSASMRIYLDAHCARSLARSLCVLHSPHHFNSLNVNIWSLLKANVCGYIKSDWNACVKALVRRWRKKPYEICSYMSLKIKLHVQQMPLTVEMAEICTYKLKYRSRNGRKGGGKEIANERRNRNSMHCMRATESTKTTTTLRKKERRKWWARKTNGRVRKMRTKKSWKCV